MCLWLLTACLGLLPSNPSPRIVTPLVPGVPAPILQPIPAPVVPLSAPTVVPTTFPTLPPTPVSTFTLTTIPTEPKARATTLASTTISTLPPTIAITVVPTSTPTPPTVNSSTMSTLPPTPVTTMTPTTSTTLPPWTVPTTASTMVSTASSTSPSTTILTTTSTATPTMVPTTNVTPTSTANTAITSKPSLTPISTAIPTMAPTKDLTPMSTGIPTMATTITTKTSETAPTPTTIVNTASTMASTTVPTPAASMAPTISTEKLPTTEATMSSPMALTMDSTTSTTMATPMATTTMPPIIINTGIQFDPRTTPGPSAAYYNAVTGYIAPIPAYNDAVRFPRDKRSIDFKDRIDLKDSFSNTRNTKFTNQKLERETCRCVPKGVCLAMLLNFEADFRTKIFRTMPSRMQCADNQEYCCTPVTRTSTTTQITTPTPKVGPTIIPCGTLQQVPTTDALPAPGQADHGEFPWQALITTNQNDYIAGGVLIDNLNVLTVTHRIAYYIASSDLLNLKVHLGDWNDNRVKERVKIQEYNISKAFVHPNFSYSTLQNDLTILRLATPVRFTPEAGVSVAINRACLPPSSDATYDEMRCMVSGFGENIFGTQGHHQTIKKKVDVSIIPSETCQNQLRATRLGPNFALDTNAFICAGGEPNEDSCTSVGGSGLVCQVNSQWVVVGLVAWGLGCAVPNVPGVYINIATHLPWIQQQITMT